jgi:hypothetical protein
MAAATARQQPPLRALVRQERLENHASRVAGRHAGMQRG